MKGLHIVIVTPETPAESPGVYASCGSSMVKLAALQAAVGGWIEPIPSDPSVTMWVNEEGKFAPLPVNRRRWTCGSAGTSTGV